MDALLARARADGYTAISLSVDKASPAVQLYERYGFAKVDEGDSAITMRAQLA
jgi:ribosomal protein S18 acetylase RimI-like enzyme